MNKEEYLNLFDPIIDGTNTDAPYDNPDYTNYTKLNASRQKRWLKTVEINEDLAAIVKQISTPQNWIVITEPWCGDAAHNIPFIIKMAELNPNIELTFELRDSVPHRIDDYLTNGGKSIPKLVAQDKTGTDLFNWGPRPLDCQVVMLKLKEEKLDFEQQKTTIQQWYNKDKGQSIQREFLTVLKSFSE